MKHSAVYHFSFVVILLGFSILCSNKTFAQSYTWNWGEVSSDDISTKTEDIAADHLGNAYLVGGFIESTASVFDTDLTNGAFPTQSQDMYLIKLNPAGEVDWISHPMHDALELFTSVAVDADGSAYVAGYFWGNSIDFGGVLLQSIRDNTADSFVAKYNPDGTVEWVTALPIDQINHLALDANGRIYLTGYFSEDQIQIDQVEFTLSGPNQTDQFILCLDQNRQAVWGHATASHGQLNDFQADADGNAYLAGIVTQDDPMSFDSFEINTSGTDAFSMAFLIQFDANGEPVWKKQPNPEFSNIVSISSSIKSLAISPAGQVIVGGDYRGPRLLFEQGTITNTSESETDAFVASYTADGDLNWATTLGGESKEFVNSIAMRNESVFIAGTTDSPRIDYANQSVSAAFNDDLFLAHVDPNGSIVWVDIIGGPELEFFSTITASVAGQIYLKAGTNSSFVDLDDQLPSLEFDADIHEFIAQYTIEDATGISQLLADDAKQNVAAYPNPNSTGSFQLDLEEVSSISVLNMQGQQIDVTTNFSPSGQVQFSLPSASAGTYFLSVQTKEQTAQALLIVQ